MSTHLVRYRFTRRVDWDDIESALVLAFSGIEALHGGANARLHAAHCLDRARRSLVIRGDEQVAGDLNRLFCGDLLREYGQEAFTFERLPDRSSPSRPLAHVAE